jgi:hypothetical protein
MASEPYFPVASARFTVALSWPTSDARGRSRSDAPGSIQTGYQGTRHQQQRDEHRGNQGPRASSPVVVPRGVA